MPGGVEAFGERGQLGQHGGETFRDHPREARTAHAETGCDQARRPSRTPIWSPSVLDIENLGDRIAVETQSDQMAAARAGPRRSSGDQLSVLAIRGERRSNGQRWRRRYPSGPALSKCGGHFAASGCLVRGNEPRGTVTAAATSDSSSDARPTAVPRRRNHQLDGGSGRSRTVPAAASPGRRWRSPARRARAARSSA